MTTRTPGWFRSLPVFWMALTLALPFGPATLAAQALEPKICPLGATPTEIVKIYGPVLRRHARVRHHEIIF